MIAKMIMVMIMIITIMVMMTIIMVTIILKIMIWMIVMTMILTVITVMLVNYCNCVHIGLFEKKKLTQSNLPLQEASLVQPSFLASFFFVGIGENIPKVTKNNIDIQ